VLNTKQNKKQHIPLQYPNTLLEMKELKVTINLSDKVVILPEHRPQNNVTQRYQQHKQQSKHFLAFFHTLV
jgi:hypothetical protein